MGLNVAIIDGMTSCTAGDLTNLATSLLTDEGVVLTDNTDLVVEQSGTPGLSVLVNDGTCYIKNTNFTKNNGEIKYWHVTVDTNGVGSAVSVDANSSGSTRIDAICVKIDTGVSPDATASNVATLVAVKGTPGAGNPTIPSNHLLLAYVSVEDGETQILDADITDSRVFIGLTVAYGTVGFNLQDTSGSIDARLYEDSDGKVILTALKSGGGIRIDQENNIVEKRGSASDAWEEIGAGGSGWIAANETWTYASATTITVPSGTAAKYSKGDKIKLTQTTVKYFYIIDVADTLLTITGGTNYTLANAAITDNYYSHVENPVGFPHWFSWTPTITGFSSNPSFVASFSLQNKLCFIRFTCSSNGTSNATTFTISLPVKSDENLWKQVCQVVDNGTVVVGIALITVAAPTVIGFRANISEGNFTSSGGKSANLEMFYSI